MSTASGAWIASSRFTSAPLYASATCTPAFRSAFAYELGGWFSAGMRMAVGLISSTISSGQFGLGDGRHEPPELLMLYRKETQPNSTLMVRGIKWAYHWSYPG